MSDVTIITMPPEFVDVALLSQELCLKPIQVELLYATNNNFIGKPIDGYAASGMRRGLLSAHVAKQLCLAQEYALVNYGCTLLIYDAYRPLRAVRQFAAWSKTPDVTTQDLALKAKYYPDVEKSQLLELGYLAPEVSAHCYGHTVDITLACAATLRPLDMGSIFDFFGPTSLSTADMSLIGADASRYRYILSQIMQRYGFVPHDLEYWHFEFSERELLEPLDFVIV